MAILTRDREPLNKAAVYRELLDELAPGRTEKSPERRMQNIASVLWNHARLPYVTGFKPLSNVGGAVEARLVAILRAEGLFDPALYDAARIMPTANLQVLDELVDDLEDQPTPTIAPAGQAHPAAVLIQGATRFERDPQIVVYVRKRSGGQCELCGASTFLTRGGRPFLEIHHVRHLAAGGSDRVQNTVALCPNDHRLLHYGRPASVERARTRLYERVAELRPEW